MTAGAAAIVVATALGVSGCASTVHLDPAPDAGTVACAAVTVRLPGELEGLASRDTDAQATAAWGAPLTVFVRCGVRVPQVSALPCSTFGGVDWLIDTSDERYLRAVSYGRAPAVEVVIDSSVPAPGADLDALAGAVRQVPATKHCL
ncbi:hypothetical protein AS850_03455 [Frondihabitans sp. 762G35]|nr:hypothetical protein AS850_03455 [Frondihabitans sp. 762G35]